MRSLLLTSAFALLLLLNPSATLGQKSLRVLVDASKDGGLWWFPQGNGHTFDPKQDHQGKPLADFMREKGWEVVELGRGEVITADTLRAVDLIVRPAIYFDYTPEEIAAYRDSVMGGTRLLLMGGNGDKPDSLAVNFGLRFDSRSRLGPVRQWVQHPLTANIPGKDFTWTSLIEAPPEAVLLAWLNSSEADARPVLGYLPYGSGYVMFVGQSFIVPSPIGKSLIGSLARYRLDDMKQLPVPAPISAATPAEVGPRLLEPIAEATLPQPETDTWRFDWEDTPGAKAYELVVLGSSAIFPLVHTITKTSEYVYDERSGYIADQNLLGWSWRVRAQHGNGKWGPWSRIRRFNVSPRTKKLN